ncbi:hypothetical protein K438DRAFT_1775493 [Mycena galopus ATCC 62051]|nr:hypothetical protein K438DRAFT_1775493 [Mycena galopus ATCC 62051]
MKSCYFYLILNFSNPLVILRIGWSLTFNVSSELVQRPQLSVIYTACIAFLFQCFYTYRVWIYIDIMLKVGARKILAPAIIVIIIIRPHSVLVINFSDCKITVPFRPSLCSLGAEIIITSTMVAYLYQGRQQGFQKTDPVLRKLMNTVDYYYPFSKCYVNSMLAFLNACESLRSQAQNANFSLGSMPHFSHSLPLSRKRRVLSVRPALL